jgi:hypothetical protein
MKTMLLAALLTALAGCASNRNDQAGGARIRDTTLSVRDTMIPNDTLPRIRDSVMDSVP